MHEVGKSQKPAIKAPDEALKPELDERARRLWAANECSVSPGGHRHHGACNRPGKKHGSARQTGALQPVHIHRRAAASPPSCGVPQAPHHGGSSCFRPWMRLWSRRRVAIRCRRCAGPAKVPPISQGTGARVTRDPPDRGHPPALHDMQGSPLTRRGRRIQSGARSLIHPSSGQRFPPRGQPGVLVIRRTRLWSQTVPRRGAGIDPRASRSGPGHDSMVKTGQSESLRCL